MERLAAVVVGSQPDQQGQLGKADRRRVTLVRWFDLCVRLDVSAPGVTRQGWWGAQRQYSSSFSNCKTHPMDLVPTSSNTLPRLALLGPVVQSESHRGCRVRGPEGHELHPCHGYSHQMLAIKHRQHPAHFARGGAPRCSSILDRLLQISGQISYSRTRRARLHAALKFQKD
jgi:hypothetical protein